MKKTITLIIFILTIVCSGFAQPGSVAQSTDVHGVVTDSITRMPIRDQMVYIQSAPYDNQSQFRDSVLTSEDGYYHFSLEMHGTPEQILFTVSTRDCEGKTHSVSFVTPNVPNPINFCLCHATLISHCEAEFIYSKNPYNPLEVAFHDVSTGNIHHWYWEFGDGTTSTSPYPYKQYDYAGNYHVILTVYDTMPNPHCWSADTVSVNISTANFYNIAGQVFHGFFPTTAGNTSIYRKENNWYVYEKTAPVNNQGVFYFYQTYHGQYLVRSFADDYSSPPYDLPTYYGNSLFWNQSGLLDLQENFYFADIHMVQAPGANLGPGRVGGVLVDSSFFASDVEGTTIFLFDKEMHPMDIEFIGPNATFNFASIDTGTYIVYPEIPGKFTVPATVIVDTAHLNTDLLFVINGPYVLSSETPDEGQGPLSLEVIPNPARDETSVFFSAKKQGLTQFRLSDITGNQMKYWEEMTRTGQNKIQVPLAGLKPGIYLLTSTLNHQSLTRKIIKL